MRLAAYIQCAAHQLHHSYPRVKTIKYSMRPSVVLVCE